MNNTPSNDRLTNWALSNGMIVYQDDDLTIMQCGNEVVNVETDGRVSYENTNDPAEPMFEMFDTVDEFLNWLEDQLRL